MEEECIQNFDLKIPRREGAWSA